MSDYDLSIPQKEYTPRVPVGGRKPKVHAVSPKIRIQNRSSMEFGDK